MSTHTITFRPVDKINFDQIKDGSKLFETRAGTEKYQQMQVGDTLVFSCAGESFSKTISEKLHFKSIKELADKINLKQVMPSVKSIEEMKKVYFSYPDYEEKIKELGIIALKLE